MIKNLPIALLFVLSLSTFSAAQNSNRPTPTPSPRQAAPQRETTTDEEPQRPPSPPMEASKPQARARRAAAATTRSSPVKQTGSPAERAVRGVFETLLDGIRKADVETVMSVYWNSPDLLLFNNNGTVTRGWEQVRANRTTSYPNLKNVEIEARDVRVRLLGRDAAIVTCLWRQAQDFRGAPETATGRLTLTYRLINNGWKVIHTHTSPEAPDASRLLPSEAAEPKP
ncbi:MAG: nuclear transport factor 2 family protein [Acidobacteriota bacterium]|nr:nuclear transport factor 2 family protein [Acidobacteriota bacterium]